VAGLTTEQRTAILQHHGGLARSYFSERALLGPATAGIAKPAPADESFADYVRLSSAIYAGAHLSRIVEAILSAPSTTQVRLITESRGGLPGRLDVASYASRAGKRIQPRTFPVWRVTNSAEVPENALAISSVAAVFSELQALQSRLQIPPSAEWRVVQAVTRFLEEAVHEPPLRELWTGRAVSLQGDAALELVSNVEERWAARRISNPAYLELVKWARRFLGTTFFGTDGFAAVAYSADFDNTLFEIFALATVRDAIIALGFELAQSLPLHKRAQEAIFILEHPDVGMPVRLYFQRGSGVIYDGSAKRVWPTIGGIPDIVVQAESRQHPSVIIDAKNRARVAADSEESGPGSSEETYKVLGYFMNFRRRTSGGGRGPVGCLIFRSDDASGLVKEHESEDKRGLVMSVALNPADSVPDRVDKTMREAVAQMLERAGMVGDRRPDGSRVGRELDEVYASVELEDVSQGAEDRRADAVHEYVQRRYYTEAGEHLEAIEREMESSLVGSAWHKLNDEERRFVVTGEVFWREHRGASGMEFGPVVIELAKALESVLFRLLVEPLRDWMMTEGTTAANPLATLGDLRAELQRAREVHENGDRHGPLADALDKFLGERDMRRFAYQELEPRLKGTNDVRRQAAHPHEISGVAAGAFRAAMLGVGPEASFLAAAIDRCWPAVSPDTGTV
jgi:hypothetical protein